MIIGAQIYTVREYAQTPEDLTETLKKIADMGYTAVQASGTFEFDCDWFADLLKQTGLTCPLSHWPVAKVLADPAKSTADHKIFGCRYVGIGGMPGMWKSLPHYDDFVRDFRPAAKDIAENGGYFMYHNHSFEFTKSADGRIYLERLADDFPAEHMGFTLDTYWVQHGGGDPAEWIEKLSGRVPCLHLKDMCFLDGQRMAAVGDGNINFDRVVSAAESAGTEYLITEQDSCYNDDPFDCLKRSYDYLHAMGLE